VRSHHALLIESNSIEPSSLVTDGEEVRYHTFQQVGIDDGRAIVTEAHRRPAPPATSLVIVVQAESVTLETQNALLKLLEEPPAPTRFIFKVQTSASFLPTLRSRFSVIQSTEKTVCDVQREAVMPFGESLGESLRAIDGWAKSKDSQWLTETKQQLIAWLSSPASAAVPAAVRGRIHSAVCLLGTRGAMNKWLLEDIALMYTSALQK
jgi:hypothetical protein